MSKLPRRSTKPPETLEDERYALAVELLRHCGDYLNVRCAFASYHSSRADCRIDDAGVRLKFRPHPESERYDTCSQLLAFGADDSPSAEIQQWFCGMKKPPPLLIDIIERTSRDADQVRVSFDSALAAKLGGHVAQPHSVLPAAWTHPDWGTGTELRSIFHALQTIAAYHLLGAARLHELPQVGGMSALLELQREDLIARVVSVAGVSDATVRKVVDSLVYGRGVKSPDPALQPLIAIGEDSLVTSPMLVLTSNMPRNFLTLLARLDPPAFNAASSVFEREMTDRVSSVLAGKSWPFRPGYQPKWLQSTAGEIDLLVADPASRNLLVVELRWMLPAGDAREVIAQRRPSPQGATGDPKDRRRRSTTHRGALGSRSDERRSWVASHSARRHVRLRRSRRRRALGPRGSLADRSSAIEDRRRVPENFASGQLAPASRSRLRASAAGVLRRRALIGVDRNPSDAKGNDEGDGSLSSRAVRYRDGRQRNLIEARAVLRDVLQAARSNLQRLAHDSNRVIADFSGSNGLVREARRRRVGHSRHPSDGGRLAHGRLVAHGTGGARERCRRSARGALPPRCWVTTTRLSKATKRSEIASRWT